MSLLKNSNKHTMAGLGLRLYFFGLVTTAIISQSVLPWLSRGDFHSCEILRASQNSWIKQRNHIAPKEK